MVPCEAVQVRSWSVEPCRKDDHKSWSGLVTYRDLPLNEDEEHPGHDVWPVKLIGAFVDAIGSRLDAGYTSVTTPSLNGCHLPRIGSAKVASHPDPKARGWSDNLPSYAALANRSPSLNEELGFSVTVSPRGNRFTRGSCWPLGQKTKFHRYWPDVILLSYLRPRRKRARLKPWHFQFTDSLKL